VGVEEYLSPIHLLEGCFGAEKPSPIPAYYIIAFNFFLDSLLGIEYKETTSLQ
jgi:hypothetical protein